ncbi:MAG: thiamine phosphate synthase [Candidatus Omnitrophica bacterium]|nr:thiamine phosphate synthase [Candidatus Omnitrophota bacterium]
MGLFLVGGMVARITDHSLYLVTSEEYSAGRSTLEVAEEALSAGVDILQMREKTKPKDELIKLGRKLRKLCSAAGAIFIVNDDPFVADQTDAEGVHLGQEDLEKYPLEVVRDIMGEGRMIGVSTHSVEQFEKANRSDADYIAYGPIFSTRTKDYSIGLADAGTVLEEAAKPVVFIGGIDLANIDSVMAAGARNIALIRAITAARDVAEETRRLKKKITSFRKKD